MRQPSVFGTVSVFGTERGTLKTKLIMSVSLALVDTTVTWTLKITAAFFSVYVIDICHVMLFTFIFSVFTSHSVYLQTLDDLYINGESTFMANLPTHTLTDVFRYPKDVCVFLVLPSLPVSHFL